MKDELVMYIVVNKELDISPEKVGAQVGHVATDIALATGHEPVYQEWYIDHFQKKILLQGKEKDLIKLLGDGFYPVRDQGFNEVPRGSLTVVGLPPMKKKEAQRYIKRLQLYKKTDTSDTSEKALLRELYETASKLDSAYLQAITNKGQSSFTGEEYDELNDVMAKAEEVLGIR